MCVRESKGVLSYHSLFCHKDGNGVEQVITKSSALDSITIPGGTGQDDSSHFIKQAVSDSIAQQLNEGFLTNIYSNN